METKNSPCRFNRTKMSAINIVFYLVFWLLFRVECFIMMNDMKLRVIRSFEHVLVKVHEYHYSEYNVDKDVAVEFINQFRNVRCSPLVIGISSLEVDAPVVVDISVRDDRFRESIDALVSSTTSAGFASEMIVWMHHELFDFLLKSWVVSWQFSFDDFINLFQW